MLLQSARLNPGDVGRRRQSTQRLVTVLPSHSRRVLASADRLPKRVGTALQSLQPAPATDVGDLTKQAKQALKDAQQAAEVALQAAKQAQDAAERAQALVRQLSEKGASSTGGEDDDFEKRKRRLPKRIFLIRHGESEGNIDQTLYCRDVDEYGTGGTHEFRSRLARSTLRVPDPIIPLTEKGQQQAILAGKKIKSIVDSEDCKLFLYVSPYKRSKQTAAAIIKQFRPDQIMGIREEPQLREQDFGNFQDAKTKELEKEERELYSRFFYRFPNGESGADVYDRITMFEDHMVRDIDEGRFPEGANIIIVTHGLTLRIFLARWFHWSVQEYESVYNPPNSEPLVLLRRSMDDDDEEVCHLDGAACDRDQQFHTKDLFYLPKESMDLLEGSSPEMSEMLVPDKAYERTLTSEELDDSCTWLDDEEAKRW